MGFPGIWRTLFDTTGTAERSRAARLMWDLNPGAHLVHNKKGIETESSSGTKRGSKHREGKENGKKRAARIDVIVTTVVFY